MKMDIAFLEQWKSEVYTDVLISLLGYFKEISPLIYSLT